MIENKVCPRCEKDKAIAEYYSPERSHCIECERTSASARMKRYNRTLKGKASQALQSSRKHIKKYGYEVFDDLTLMDVIFTFAFADGECSYCGTVTDDYHMEHIVALSNGGPNTLSNICVSCSKCNGSKNNHNLLEWRDYEDVSKVIAQVASRRGVPIAEVLEEFKQ